TGAVDLGGASRWVTVTSGSRATLTNTLAGAAGSGLNKDGPGTLTLTGATAFNGPTLVNQGALVFTGAPKQLGGALTVAAGAVALSTASGSGTTTVVATSLGIDSAGAGKFDLTNNALVVDYAGAS